MFRTKFYFVCKEKFYFVKVIQIYVTTSFFFDQTNIALLKRKGLHSRVGA